MVHGGLSWILCYQLLLLQCILHVQLVKENGKVLVLSDGSLLPFMAASLGAKEVCEWEEIVL